MDATVQSLCGEKVLLQDLHFRTYIRPALALTPHKGATTATPTGGKKGASEGASTICSYDLLAQPKVKAESGKLVVCARRAACPKEDSNISTLSKADVSAALKWLPETLRMAALTKIRGKV